VLHFGTALDTWGSGLATAVHDELVERLRAHGVVRPVLHVYAANARGRRFWEKHGWRPTGEVVRGSFPPYAELLAYELSLGAPTATATTQHEG
jgi:GNAT superfamily N-acetyltransferase